MRARTKGQPWQKTFSGISFPATPSRARKRNALAKVTANNQKP
jgi:hypothetical protein